MPWPAARQAAPATWWPTWSGRSPEHPIQFGYTVLIAEDDRGCIAFPQVSKGNPADAGQLSPAVEGVIEAIGRIPATVVGDRGFGAATKGE
ncbi:hypothetical protein [Nonomuraea sp. NPDC049480]|uniref:hypothetical protein n=1 Tax=Nonomuraea sp. NPDC049480 TaxID=3364353 RepID=UPI0037AC22F4